MTELSNSSRLSNMIYFSPRRTEVDQSWLMDEKDSISKNSILVDQIIELYDSSSNTYQNPNNSSVLYVIGLTNQKPEEYPEMLDFSRGKGASLCDIDLDFDSRYRDHMVSYTIEKYGDDRVARIITFGQIKSRAAVRDTARVLGFSYGVGDKIAKKLPPLLFGKDTPLKACLTETEKYKDSYQRAAGFRDLYNNDTDVRAVVDLAAGIEGLIRTDGIHAAAVVIAPGPLTDYVPVQRKNVKGEPGPIVTQYAMNDIDKLGLLKMDFLSLRNLDVITDTCKAVGIEIDDDREFKDQGVYDLLSAGDTVGVFQLESPPMRELLHEVRPDCFEDIAAVLALYRPGPMAANMHHDYAARKHGRQSMRLPHPDAAEVLAETYSLCIFQEQVLSLARKFAGYSLGEADLLRKAMGKKIPEEMEKERAKFVSGAIELGYGQDLGVSMFDMIAEFSNYAFGKAHSYGYAVLSYQTAYLKAHHPTEYMAALMTSVQNDQNKLTLYLNEAKAMGVSVLCPDINISGTKFEKTGDSVVSFGLAGVRDVGMDPSQMIVIERSQNGNFKSFFDYVKRIPRSGLNKKTVNALIKGGAFDNLGHSRKGLHSVFESIIKSETAIKKETEVGVMRLFDTPPATVVLGIPDEEWTEQEQLRHEKQSLGVYVTGHPVADVVRRKGTANIGEIADAPRYGTYVKVVGVLLDVEEKWTKKGDRMIVFNIEDLTGGLPCVLFPRQTKQFGIDIMEDSIVELFVQVTEDRDTVKFIVDDVRLIRKAATGAEANVHVYVPEGRNLANIKSKIRRAEGNKTVVIHHKGETEVLSKDFKCSIQGLKKELSYD